MGAIYDFASYLVVSLPEDNYARYDMRDHIESFAEKMGLGKDTQPNDKWKYVMTV